MSDLVGNPEDRFSQNETHLAADKFQTVETPAIISSYFLSNYITKTCPCFKHQIFQKVGGGGERTGLMVRASDSGSGDPGSILGRVGVFVSLSKRHLLPKSTGNTQE